MRVNGHGLRRRLQAAHGQQRERARHGAIVAQGGGQGGRRAEEIIGLVADQPEVEQIGFDRGREHLVQRPEDEARVAPEGRVERGIAQEIAETVDAWPLRRQEVQHHIGRSPRGQRRVEGDGLRGARAIGLVDGPAPAFAQAPLVGVAPERHFGHGEGCGVGDRRAETDGLAGRDRGQEGVAGPAQTRNAEEAAGKENVIFALQTVHVEVWVGRRGDHQAGAIRVFDHGRHLVAGRAHQNHRG